MVVTIRTLRTRADEAYTSGMKSSAIAEQARADYIRLGRENRERFAARGYDAVSADAAFARYAVTQDCIDTEQMHGRWAGERLLVARETYAKVTALMDQLSAFLNKRAASRSIPSPRKRSES